MRWRSFTANGNVVSAYTGSPSRAFLVEIAWASDSGIFVPAGMVAAFGSGGSASVAPAGAPVNSVAAELVCVVPADWPAAESAGFGVSACPHAIPETRSSVNTPRITHLRGTRRFPQITQDYHGCIARMPPEWLRV